MCWSITYISRSSFFCAKIAHNNLSRNLIVDENTSLNTRPLPDAELSQLQSLRTILDIDQSLNIQHLLIKLLHRCQTKSQYVIDERHLHLILLRFFYLHRTIRDGLDSKFEFYREKFLICAFLSRTIECISAKCVNQSHSDIIWSLSFYFR